MNIKYKIDYGVGIAYLYTPYEPKERFYTLANTCFGIRKCIMCCLVLSEEKVECEDFERLEFSGDVYVWNEDGARKMLKPFTDEDWDNYYCEQCKFREVKE